MLAGVAVSVGLLGAGFFGDGPEEARATFPGSNGDVAFEAQGLGGGSGLDVFVTDGAGRAPANLTQDEPAGSEERSPAFSADGKRIAYASDSDHLGEEAISRGSDLYAMNAPDGTSKVRLTTDGGVSPYGKPAFSPDAKRVFFSGRDGTLYSVGTDGTGKTPVAAGAWGDVDVSPDGTLLAFEGDGGEGAVTGNDGTIFVARLDGTGLRVLSSGEGEESSPRFLPDGRLVFSRDLGFADAGPDPARYVVNPDGSGERRISGGYGGLFPSPDGASAITKRQDGLYVSALDGSGARRIVGDSGASGDLSFVGAPDWGKQQAAPAPAPAPAPNTAPTVTNIRPAPGSATSDRTPLIQATVRDAQTDLGKANVRVLVDGRARTFSYSAATDRATLVPALARGRHTVRVEARDPQGLTAARGWAFTVR